MWADETSALGFDERSGDTFVVGPLALELMTLLEEGGPATGGALAARLAESLGADAPPTLAADVAVELRTLSVRGLFSPLS